VYIQDVAPRLSCFQAFCFSEVSLICDFITNDSAREQTKPVDLPLVTADRRHAILGHAIRRPEETRLIQCYSMLPTSRMEVTLQQAGSKRPAGRPWKTWLQQVIADQDCDIDVIWSFYNPRWSGAAVSE